MESIAADHSGYARLHLGRREPSMRKKALVTVIILAVIAWIAVAFHQIYFIDMVKKMHGG